MGVRGPRLVAGGVTMDDGGHDVRGRAVGLLGVFGRLKWKMAAAGLLVGLVSGLLVVAYRLGVEYGTDAARWMYARIQGDWWLLVPWTVAVVGGGLLVSWMVGREPMASGSGIPQTSGVVVDGLSMRWQTILPVRFLGGLLGAVMGLSLGREGPSIQIGACGAQFVSHRLRRGKRDDTQERYLVTAGAAAGLSAAFSAPLSGMMFALEGVHRSFSPVILMGATAASLTADFVSKYCFGLKPVLDFVDMPQMTLSQYWWTLPLGLVSGLSGSLTNRLLLGSQTAYAHVPQRWRVVLALALALPVGLLLPDVLGGGSNLIALSEQARTGLGMLCLLLAVKLLFTCTSFGSGAPGGIFMPILAIGALGGGVCGVLARDCAGLAADAVPLFAVCVMAGTLSAAVKTPVTSILLTVEMTGTMVHMLPVAVVAFVAMLVSDVLKTRPIYAVLLERYIAGRGGAEGLPSRIGSGVMEFPVEMGSAADGRRVRDVSWPSGCLIIGLRRGETETVPRGDTAIRAGDYLIVLFSGEEESGIRRAMNGLCRIRD